MTFGKTLDRQEDKGWTTLRLRKLFITVLILLFIVIILIGVGWGCGGAAGWVGRQVVEHRLEVGDGRYGWFRVCTRGLPVVTILEKLLSGRTYIVVLQNNNELRATGGFMGSYARVTTDQKGIREIFVQDIYQPDGQIAGHVEPPYPIQEAFGQGWWRLRDANWDPDFPLAAASIKWFFEQGGEPRVDGIVAINQLTTNQMLKIFGPIELVTYGEKVTVDNFNQLAREYAEGAKDKRGFLGAVGAAMIEKIKAADQIDLLKLMKLVYDQLRKGEIVAWFEDADWQNETEKLGWGGRLAAGWDAGEDYLYIVESNLGSNKANCCIERQVVQEIEGETERVGVVWKNNNGGESYVDYVRVVVPSGNKIQDVKVQGRSLRRSVGEDFALPNALRQGLSEDMYVVEQRGDLQIIGFWAVVPVGQKVAAEVDLEGKIGDKVFVKKQPGIGELPYKLIVDGKVVVDKVLEADEWIKLKR